MVSSKQRIELYLTNIDASTSDMIHTLVSRHGNDEDCNTWLTIAEEITSRECELAVKLFKENRNGSSSWRMEFDIMNVSIPAIPVIATFLSGVGQTNRFKTNWALDYINSLQRMEDDRLVLEAALTRWKMTRETLLERLRVIAVEIKDNRQNESYVKLLGAATALGGTLAVLVALGSSVIAGPATPLLVGGCFFGVLGRVTVGGASIASDVLSKNGEEEANRLIEENKVAFSELCQAQIRYQDGIRAHIEIIQRIDRVILFSRRIRKATTVYLCIGRKSKKYIGTISSIAKVGSLPGTSPPVFKLEMINRADVTQTAVTAVVRASIGLTDIISVTLVRTLGMVAGSLAIGSDIYTMMSTALDISEGYLDEASDKIDDIVQKLRKVTPPTLNDIIIESVISVAGNLGIPFEGDYETTTTNAFYYREEWVVTSKNKHV